MTSPSESTRSQLEEIKVLIDQGTSYASGRASRLLENIQRAFAATRDRLDDAAQTSYARGLEVGAPRTAAPGPAHGLRDLGQQSILESDAVCVATPEANCDARVLCCSCPADQYRSSGDELPAREIAAFAREALELAKLMQQGVSEGQDLVTAQNMLMEHLTYTHGQPSRRPALSRAHTAVLVANVALTVVLLMGSWLLLLHARPSSRGDADWLLEVAQNWKVLVGATVLVFAVTLLSLARSRK